MVKDAALKLIPLSLLISVTIFFQAAGQIQASEGDSCPYDQHCDPGTGNGGDGQQSCSGTIQGGACTYDASVPPNCSACQPISGGPPDSTPTPTFIPGSNPLINWSQGSVPEKIDQPRDPGIAGWFRDAFIWLLYNTIKKGEPKEIYTAAENSQKVTVPAEVQAPPDKPLLDKFKDFFSPQGLFGNTPFNSENAPDDAERLKASERSWFPDEIKPLTGTVGTGATK